MKEKFLAPYETAKALKGAGYLQEESDYVYYNGDIYPRLMRTQDEDFIAAPTYIEVMDWFKEKNILFSVTCDFYVNTTEPWYRGAIIVPDMSFANTRLTNTCSSYEECINDLIFKAIELI